MKLLACGSVSLGLSIAVRIGVVGGEKPGQCGIIVIHGACRGADLLAAEAAINYGWNVLSFPAPWKNLGSVYRNERMAEQNPDVCVAFLKLDQPNTGTWDMIHRCVARRIPVLMFSA